ncbi:unnamed protein product [Rotaria socialis]|uniref:G-protein coupled receptors family 1 profile domain-containing protein n=1 Tax=Rotaria socialis TaxID=392032 RepID=A0A821JZU3_9BILA|nr:unnamed protein product [Rotaria socialis]CAF3441260.1 unnamed protein product [Rotaria socialis]CAF4658010.1 unnamed protein product [Rotaria socialis]CAF4727216.1 unnamed protein product [Rotaria socialis]
MYCDIVRVVGIFLSIAAFIGIILNGALVYSFIRYNVLRSSPNIHVMFIAIIGLMASCSILPSTGTSSIYCRWLYRCFYGCSSSYLLCTVSLSRCYIIMRPFHTNKVTIENSVCISSVVVSISFVWSILPIIGWNEYTLEGTRTSCCINWYDQRLSYVSFTFFLFFVVYLIPLLILIAINTVTLIGLKRMRDKARHGMCTIFTAKRIEMEQRIVKNIVITTVGFTFSWTPYAGALFVLALCGKHYAIPPLATFMCDCFAKTSVIWVPLLYMSTYNSIYVVLRIISNDFETAHQTFISLESEASV